MTYQQYKVEPDHTAGFLAYHRWHVTTPGDLGDFIIAEDLGPRPTKAHPGARRYRERGSGFEELMIETPEGLMVVPADERGCEP